MLPLSLLRTAVGHPMLVELKNGETYNGHLVNCDTWMNLHLREVICTSKDGDRFWRMAECYVRGNTVKYLRVPDEVIDKVQENEQNLKRNDKRPAQRGRGRGRTGDFGGGRGRGEGGGGRGGGGDGDTGGRGGRGGGRGGAVVEGAGDQAVVEVAACESEEPLRKLLCREAFGLGTDSFIRRVCMHFLVSFKW
eukprot:CAMPEP_0114301880 /NCGR_PEP_ID=MMETSP0059-20121206/14355_1 /TAXON_ID=36894 /ORGANISM="Pyramimonas parkeae, Strain CCMP726" /LENGTH=192 /DNA_ID=CAMNT_0001424673 /DNA_START=162 /DNA_END=737 /DNA_ORIENTATION=-